MNRLFLPALLILALSACTIYREYPIEIYKPGEVVIPGSVSNLAIIYRNFKYPEDTLQHFYKNGDHLVKTKRDPENLDSILVYTCLNKLAENLEENITFEQVLLFPYNAFEQHTSEKLPAMSPGLLQKIASASNIEWLISLETFSSFFSKYPETSVNPASNEVVTVAVWGIYDLEQNRRIEIKEMIDTIYWNGYDDRGNYIKNYKPPPRLTALQIASSMAGENFAELFYASWQTVNRMYSIPPLPDFSNAAYYLEEGDWDRAISLWKKYTTNRNGKLAINACYNLALAYELKDEIIISKNWLEKGYQLAVRYGNKEEMEMIRAYQEVLNERIKDFKKLN